MIKTILKQINSYGRESFFVISTNIIQVAEKIIILVIVSSALSIGDFGIYGLALTVQTFFNQFLYVPFSNGFFRFLPISISFNQKFNFYVSSFRIWLALSSITILIFLLVCLIAFFTSKSEWLFILSLILFFTLSSSFIELIIMSYKALRNHQATLKIRLLDLALKIILIVIIGLNRIEDIFIILVLSSFLIFIYNFKFLKYFSIFRHTIRNKYWIKKVLHFSKFFYIWGGFIWVQNNSSKWIIEILDTNENLGLFNGLYQITYTPIILIGSTFLAFILPIINQKIKITGYSDFNLHSLLNKSIAAALVLLCLIIIVVSLFDKTIVLLILGEKFIDISDLMVLSIIASFFYSLHLICAYFVYSMLSPKKMLLINILVPILTVIISIPLIYFYSIKGAVYALLISNLVFLLITYMKTISTLRTKNYI